MLSFSVLKESDSRGRFALKGVLGENSYVVSEKDVCILSGSASILQSFLFGGGGKEVLQCIFGSDFLSLHTTIALGVENYPCPSMSCWSDDQAQLLPCFNRPLNSEFRNYICLRINFQLQHRQGSQQKNPRMNKLDSSMLKSENQVTLFFKLQLQQSFILPKIDKANRGLCVKIWPLWDF